VEGRPAETENAGSWFDLLDDEEEYKCSARYVRHRDYWREQLENLPEPVTLSGKPPARSRRIIRRTDYLPGTVTDALRALGFTHGASFPQVITAAVALYMHRLTGARDLTLGMPVTTRIGEKRQRIFGMVSNNLPLRLTIEPGDKLVDLWPQVARRMRGALRHQHYRMEDLRRDLGLRPDETDAYGTVVNVLPFDYHLSFAEYPVREHLLSAGPVDDFAIIVSDRLYGCDARILFSANPAHYTAEELATHQRRFVALLGQLAVAHRLCS